MQGEPSQFYTGIVADLYAELRSVPSDPEPYARFIARWGQPALELGCGDGDPLLDLRSRDLIVDGLDSSPDMLSRCRRAAEQRNIDVTLYEQSMQNMNLDRRYRSIYIAGPTFNLLPDDESALGALQGIKRHLESDGAALVPLFIPTPTPPNVLGKFRTKSFDDGTEMRFAIVSEERDESTRRQINTLRYERVTLESRVTEDRPWVLHWHTQDGFRELARAAQLTVRSMTTPLGETAEINDNEFVAVLTPM